MLFLNNRHHDPTLATFISVDPLVVQTGEPYTYGSANPVTYSDPTGLCSIISGNLYCGGRNFGENGSGYDAVDGADVNMRRWMLNEELLKIQREQRAQARAAVPVVQEFDTVDELLAGLDSLVDVGDPVASGGEEGAAALTNTVSAYRRADGTYVASYVRYNAGVADVGNSYMRAGTLDVVTRRVGRTFLVLDATVTAISSYREADGHSQKYRLSYSAVKTTGTLAGGAAGAALGGKGGGAAGFAIGGPPGAGVGAFVGGVAGALLGGWAGARAADEIWDFSYERIS